MSCPHGSSSSLGHTVVLASARGRASLQLVSKMQTAVLRSSAFSGANVRGGAAPVAASRSRSAMVVRAVQDVKGTVVSTAMQNTVVVSPSRALPVWARSLVAAIHSAGESASLRAGTASRAQVNVDRFAPHPKYFKRIRASKR